MKSEKGKKIIIGILSIVLIIGITIIVLSKLNKKNTINTNGKTFSSEYSLTDNNLQLLDLYFLKAENKESNMVYSPISVKYALAMLSDAAKGDSKSQIDSVLGKYTPKKYINSNNVSFANAMFIRDSFKQSVKESYADLIKEKYNGEVIYDSFDSPNNINSWVSDKTFNLINNLMDDVSNNNFMLINALAIDMNWNYLIQPILTDNNSSDFQKKVYDKKHFNFAAWHVDYLHQDLNSMYISSIAGDEYPIMKFNNKDVQSLKFGASINNYDIVNDLGKENIRNEITKEYEKWDLTHLAIMPTKLTPTQYYHQIIKGYFKTSTSLSSVWYIYKRCGARVALKCVRGAMKMWWHYVKMEWEYRKVGKYGGEK